VKIFEKIKRNIWPIFAEDDEEQKNKNANTQKKYGDKDSILSQMAHITDEDYAKHVTETAKGLFEDERDRLKTVEGKAVTLLSATGLIISLIVNFSKEIKVAVAGAPSKIIGTMILLFFLLTIVYFLRSIWFSLKALGRKAYHQLDIKDIMDSKLKNKVEYFKKIGSVMIASRVKNYDVINEKVESVVTSHRYFKRGIICLVAVGLLYMVYTTNLVIFNGIKITAYTHIPQILLIRLGLILNVIGALFLISAVTKNTQGSYEESPSGKLLYLAVIKSPLRLKIGIILIISGFLLQIIGTV